MATSQKQQKTKAMLFIFSGLPGTGKTTLSQALAQHRQAVHLRIDTIEQQLRVSGIRDIGPMGYAIAYVIAKDNLSLGLNVVADSVNPIAISRLAWQQAAAQAGADFINIEVICSDVTEHQHRIESRGSHIPKLRLPTWQDVLEREYESWDECSDRIALDTAGRSEAQSIIELFQQLGI